MFAIDFNATVDRPIDEVFDRILDIDKYPEWLPISRIFIDCQLTSSGPVQVGTTFVDETRAGAFSGEIVRLDKPNEVVFHNHLCRFGLAVLETLPSYILEEIAEGTSVHHYGHGRCFGLFKLIEPRVARLAKEERRRTLKYLRRSMEG